MNDLLRNFNLLSYGLGFLTGLLLWFLYARLRPLLSRVNKNVRVQNQSIRNVQIAADEIRLTNDILKYAQGCHIAANLFSLDEILVAPRLLAPPVPPGRDTSIILNDITYWTIPYMPDWPELGTRYGATTLTLADALSGGANIVITGHPGVGKTVALASFASQIIQNDPKIREQNSQISSMVPLLIHAADIILPLKNPDNPIQTLIDAISKYTSSATTARLPKLLPSLLNGGRGLILLDGLDEQSPVLFDRITNFIGGLLEKFPGLRIVVTASPYYLGELTHLGFFPIPIAGWDQNQRINFLARWGTNWSRHITSLSTDDLTSPMLLSGWLLNNTSDLTPLELTLKIWAAFAGDSIGPTPRDAIEAFIRRCIQNQPAKNLRALEHLAAQMVLSMQTIVSRRDTENCLAGGNLQIITTTPNLSDENPAPAQLPTLKQEGTRAFGVLPQYITSGMLIEHAGDQLTIVHPIISGYLASQEIKLTTGATHLVGQPIWTGNLTTLGYLAADDSQPSWLEVLLSEENSDPLRCGLFMVSRWLRISPEKYPWVQLVMRKLAGVLQHGALPVGIKARAVTALALSSNTGVIQLFRQMITSPQAELRHLGVLALGLIRDPKVVPEISNLTADGSPIVSRAALLALISIGNKIALETAASILLHGNDIMSQAAAEALANHPEEGFPTLEEASALEDPKIRRAAAFGLARTHQPAAFLILDRMRLEDTQWLVQDAASQLLASIEAKPNVPTPLPELPQTPWLIEYAGERGMGVAPGKPALDLLYKAIGDGTNEQRLAAIYYLSMYSDEDAVLPLYRSYYSNNNEICEAALIALLQTAASGVNLPPPAQYGL